VQHSVDWNYMMSNIESEQDPKTQKTSRESGSGMY